MDREEAVKSCGRLRLDTRKPAPHAPRPACPIPRFSFKLDPASQQSPRSAMSSRGGWSSCESKWTTAAPRAVAVEQAGCATKAEQSEAIHKQCQQACRRAKRVVSGGQTSSRSSSPAPLCPLDPLLAPTRPTDGCPFQSVYNSPALPDPARPTTTPREPPSPLPPTSSTTPSPRSPRLKGGSGGTQR